MVWWWSCGREWCKRARVEETGVDVAARWGEVELEGAECVWQRGVGVTEHVGQGGEDT